MESFLFDLRYSFRTLRKAPAFTLIAVVCLALGIATNTTLFSVFDAILLRPFPFRAPDELVTLREIDPKDSQNRQAVSYPNFLDWRAQTQTLADIGAFSYRSIAITEGEEPERVAGNTISWNLFGMLGIQPQLGRLFREDEDKAGAPGVVLLSDAVWRRRYASDPAVLNRVISVNNQSYTVVGVMPPKFKFPQEAELWLPIGPLQHADHRDWGSVQMVGRLKPGVAIATADKEVANISAKLNEQYSVNRNARFVGSAAALRDDFIPEDVKLITLTMMGAVTFVLLIACANVANLMLTRATGRAREIAVRAAIGAGRGRIVRQLLTEAIVLGLLAGALSLPLIWEGLRLIQSAIPAEDPLPYYIAWSMDVRTLFYTMGISLITGVVFGLAPAVQASRGALSEALKDGGRGSGGGVRRNRMRSAFVIVEIALSLVLLVGASLFARSFFAMQSSEVGFATAPIMTMRFFLPGTRYDSTAGRTPRVRDIVQRVEALPGVEAATISNLIPLGDGGNGSSIEIEGQAVEKGKEPGIFWTGVEGHWFETLGVKIAEGRTFTDTELRDSVPVAVINKAMAAKFWPGTDAVGHRFRLMGDSSNTWFAVIGTVADFRTDGLDNNGPIGPSAFLPYRFLPVRNHGLMVRVRGGGDPVAITSSVRGAIRASDPAIPAFSVATMESVRKLSFWQYGLFGAMFGAFGAIALFLAAIGVYGVISYGVQQRTREIGVRVALGAQRADVISLVVKQGMLLAGVGIGFGLVAAFGVTRVVSSLLIGVSPTDLPSFVGVSVFLALVAFLASFIPARRASGVDPIVALRFE